MAEPLKRLFTVCEYHSMAAAGILSEDDRISPLAFPDLGLSASDMLG